MFLSCHPERSEACLSADRDLLFAATGINDLLQQQNVRQRILT